MFHIHVLQTFLEGSFAYLTLLEVPLAADLGLVSQMIARSGQFKGFLDDRFVNLERVCLLLTCFLADVYFITWSECARGGACCILGGIHRLVSLVL